MNEREILFRGKRTYNGEWIEGIYCPYIWAMFFKRSEKPHIIILSDDKNIDGLWCEVLPETVGQFTGLTDKNGKRIFEGDIVKCTDTINDFEFNAVVEFGNPNGEYNWGYQLKFISGEESNFDILCWVDMEETGAYIEIIGNIHDNPELLEGGEGE